MRLFTSPRAPNPRRVLMFLHEKGITGIDFVPVDLNTGVTEFNDTYEQHQASSAKLQAWCTASEENRKKCA